MEAIKNVGWGLLGIAIIVAVFFVAALLINGMAWVYGHVLEYLIAFNNIVTALCIVVLLPLAPFQKTRIGVCEWVYGFMVTYEIWGGVGRPQTLKPPRWPVPATMSPAICNNSQRWPRGYRSPLVA